MSIGERIKRLRTERHLSQAALAARLGVTRTAVTHWESETSEINPSMANIMKLCDFFGINHEMLLAGSGQPSGSGEAAPTIADDRALYPRRSDLIDQINRRLQSLTIQRLDALAKLLECDE